MKYWWVNQNQTFRQEILGGYMWSPKRSQRNSYNQFYENMRLVSSGDLVFSYYNQEIQHIGIVLSAGVSAPKPEEFGAAGSSWSNDGWYVPVDWYKPTTTIRPKKFIDEIRPLLPSKYSPLNPETGWGYQSVYLANVPEPLGALLLAKCEASTNSVLAQAKIAEDAGDDLSRLDEALERKVLNDTQIDETERASVVKARRGQGKFRQNVEAMEIGCRVTGVTDKRLLRASHIKPWRSCENNHERLDGYNGLLLSPHVDLLFDGGFISFENNGKPLISEKVDRKQLLLLGLPAPETWSVEPFEPNRHSYLQFHRGFVFKKDQ